MKKTQLGPGSNQGEFDCLGSCGERDAARPRSYVGNVLGSCEDVEATSQRRLHRRQARVEAAVQPVLAMPQA